MSRYAPLTSHLRNAVGSRVPMSFSEIEKIIGGPLPASATNHRAWWSNNPTNSVMTKAWLEAGFRSEQVDMEGRHLVFHRVHDAEPSPPATPASGAPLPPGAPPEALLRGLYGGLAGTVTVPAGTDLTAPTAEDWRADR